MEAFDFRFCSVLLFAQCMEWPNGFKHLTAFEIDYISDAIFMIIDTHKEHIINANGIRNNVIRVTIVCQSEF